MKLIPSKCKKKVFPSSEKEILKIAALRNKLLKNIYLLYDIMSMHIYDKCAF